MTGEQRLEVCAGWIRRPPPGSQTAKVLETQIPVMSPEDLIAMKVFATIDHHANPFVLLR